jgi:threonine dehydratase
MKVGLEKKAPFTVPAATTLADGLAVRTTGTNTLKMCAKYVDEVITVTEGEIANTMLQLLEKEKIVAEGAGAAAIAAVINGKVKCGKQVCCIISGGNVDVTVRVLILFSFFLF